VNAPARIDHPQKAKEPHWARYLPQVEMHCPGCSEDEARHRAGLMLLRDLAAVKARRASDEAAAVLEVVQRVATLRALSALSVPQLDATRRALIRAFTAARDLEEVFGNNGGG
jgi:hypothetical protein